ncbi:hypothetical protein LP420_31895 [Massilia sp. B-10]|nr:hypothetical protein LP420_31895 [Massilia sp. B-10]UUZ53345.1 hypothetical protein LP419_31435 [Massilia sp. H-1]
MSSKKIEVLSYEDREAVRRAMEYWIACWDWECPTLFGIGFVELDQVHSQWTDGEYRDENMIALAVTGSLRELLFGASAQPESSIQGIIGVPYSHAVLLLEQLNGRYKAS